MRTVRIEILRDEGWETVTVEDVEQIRVAGAPGEAGLQLTLIGIRPEQPNQVEPSILDVADRHESLLDSDLPTIDGDAIPIALRDRASD